MTEPRPRPTCAGSGRAVAAALAGAWRNGPPDPACLPAARGPIVPLLLDGGLSGLASARLPPAVRATPAGRELLRAARADAGAAARLDARLPAVVRALAAAGADPVVTKGWAVARYYPDPGRRPYSDLDVCARPDRAAAAQRALAGLGADAADVDLHVGLPDLPDRTWTGVFARTRVVEAGGVGVRVLAPEDQFRLLGVHLVRHVCHRPLWLVDVAVLLESVGPEMDWDLCLRGSHAWRRWLLAVAGLAGQLVGARLPAGINGLPGTRPPDWLVGHALWRWGGGGPRGRDLLKRPGAWWPYVANTVLNPVRWAYRLRLPPVGFVPAVWAAAIIGRGVQPYPRLWRALMRKWRPAGPFPVHERRTF